MNRRQEVHKLFLALKKEDTFFFQSLYINRKTFILDKIGRIGTASNIPDLIPLTKHENKQLREKAVETIEVLFQEIDTKNNIYNSLRDCQISSKDLDTYQNLYKKEHLTTLLTIASMNGSGFVRENAIKKFNFHQNPKAVKYLLFRLSDWVKPVRETAKLILDKFLTLEHLEAFVEQISTVEWLLKVKRTNLEFEYQKIINFLIIEHLDEVLQVFSKQKEKNRLILAKRILKSQKIEPQILKLLVKDKSFLIRKLVAKNIERFYFDDLKEILLKDKTDRVRLNTLYSLIKLNKITDKEWYYFLIDKSFWIRDLARFELKNENIDFINYYKKQIQSEQCLDISILGLGEIDGIKDIEYFKKFLYHANEFVRQSAVVSILKIDEYAIEDYLLQKLSSTDNRVKKVAINHFSKYPDNETLNKIRAIYDNGNSITKISVLKLFKKINSNRIYPDLLKGVEAENQEVSKIASTYLKHWNSRNFNRVFD